MLVKDTNGDNKINLYVCGFQNSYGEWFTFQGYDRILQTSPLHAAGDLFGRRVGYTGMGRVGINKAQAVQHPGLRPTRTTR